MGAARSPAPQTYTPKYLADKILTSKAALEGERKQVTVLFADLKGSMEMLADRDPEEARKVLDPVLDRMMEAVHRYEGTVNQVMGDGIMALFGAPLAHEDHAVRACYAALRMQDLVKRYAEEARRTHGVTVQIRVGVNSGEVVVRSIGSDLNMDYTAVGQTTNLAARMEQLASPGSILLGPATLDLVEGFVEVRSLGPVPVKGLAEAVEIYELTGAGPARTRLQATARRGLTRFVGRDAEMEQLRRAQQLAGNSHGQVAAVVGEAGVGKSRLIYEFTHSHRLQGWLVLEAASVSYGKATSYLPVIDLLKGYFKIHDRDDLREIREKVTGKLLTLDRSLEPTLPPLLALLDVNFDDVAWRDMDPGQRRRQTLDALKRLFLSEAREQPIVVIFEDLHWIDRETQALLDGLVESLGSQRLLLIVDYRPEYRHTWNGKTYYGQMRLDTLPAESAGELLQVLLGDDQGLVPLKQLLVKRGNPFFLEETVRTLVETKVLVGERGGYRLTQPLQVVQIPVTVQAVLAARIDRLSPGDKRLLQVASVIGKDVPFALLQAVADLPDETLRSGLDHLHNAEFLYEKGFYPDLEYSFKHALTHDVTYGGLLQERRRELHARVVDEIERLHRDRLDEQIERLSHHALRGEMGERAANYLRQAGVKAAARSALPDARFWFEQALAVQDALPESQAVLEQAFDIRLELRPVLTLLAEQRISLERLREAEAIAQKLNDDRRRGLTCAIMTNNLGVLGELDEALLTGGRALEIARRLGDLRLRICAVSYLVQTYGLRGDYAQAVELATDNLAALPVEWAAEHFGNAVAASIFDRAQVAASLAQLGRFTDAERYAAEAMRLAEPTHHAWTIGLTHWYAFQVPFLKGEWTKASSVIDHGIVALRAGGVPNMLPQSVAASAAMLAQLRDTGIALDRLREAEQLLDQVSATSSVSRAVLMLTRAYLLLSRLDDAWALSERLIQTSAGQWGIVAHALQLRGDIATHPDRFDAESGETNYRKALELAEPRQMRPLIAHCHLGLGKLYARTGKRQLGHEHLSTASTMYREMEMQFWLPQAETALKGL